MSSWQSIAKIPRGIGDAFRRALILVLALAALVAGAPAFAQAPPPVPALPDSERRTSYSISSSTCACSVGFALYGDSTDYQNWIEVYVNGVRVNYNDATFGWTITSPTGSLATIPRPVTDGVLTFNQAQTGTIQIVGARRPRRVTTFSENRGVAARDLNQGINDITATLREMWDKTNDITGRGLFSQPGVTLGPLPQPSACVNGFIGFDATGLNPLCRAGGTGSGNVVGPPSSTAGHFAIFNNATGNLLADHTIQTSDLPTIPLSLGGLGGSQSAATTNQIPVFPGGGGAAAPTSGATWLNQLGPLSFSNDQHFGSGTPWVDVKSAANGCAAVAGNGSTDDTAAIQCQLNWIKANLGGGVLYLPHGNYLVSSPGLVVKGGVFVQGAGRDVTTITANTDTNVITFDASTCTRGIGMADTFVVGYQNASATQDVAVVGSNCAVTLSRNYIWGGHHALNTAGFDGTYTDNFFCGWTGDNVYSTGANWYFSDKLDSCGNPSTANGFEQGNVSGTTENYFYRLDTSCGSCTNSIKINDGTGTHAYSFFYGAITSSPIVISNAIVTAFIGGEFGSTSFTGAGSISITGVRATSSTTPSGGTYNCASNFNIGCVVQNSNLTGSGATTVAGQTCTLGSTCGLSTLNNSLGSPVTMTTLGTYYDGPSVAQGTTGTWFASGTAAITQSANVNDIITCKLWDGTTVIDSDVMIGPVSSGTVSHHLSGYLASPAGNLKISCSNASHNGGSIATTNGVDAKASTISAVRIN